MKQIIVLGNSGNTPDIIDIISVTNGLKCVGILDDQTNLHGQYNCGVQILGGLASAKEYPDCHFVSGIHGVGSHKMRDTILSSSGCPQDKFISIIHPSAVISPSATIGLGTVILANVTICANVTIGNHCIVLPNSVVNHDVIIGNYVAVASSVSLSGYVSIGSLSYIGVGAVVRERVSIGEKSLVAMGAVVVKNVDPDTTVMGCPARPVSRDRTSPRVTTER